MKQTRILEILDLGEDRDREFKSARGGLPRSLGETYSSMANTEGGVIILGVKEKSDGRFEVQGLSDTGLSKLKSDFWNTINNRGHVNINLLRDEDLDTKTVSGKRVLLISVPMATRYQRPVFLGTNPMTGTYRRNYEGDYCCTKAEVRSMLLDASEEPADSRVVEHFGFDDIDIDSLMQYRNRFSARSPGHTWLSEDPEGLFRKLGGWRRDRRTGKEGITVAGLLMFGKHDAITDPAAIPAFHLDYQEQLSDDSAVRWTDRITFDGTWECNIFQFFQRVIPRLTSELKIPFQLEPGLLRKDDTLVHEAIRWAEYHLPHKEPSLPHKQLSLPHKEASLPHKMLPSSEALAAQELTSLQVKTAEARQAKRLPPEKTREIIALICSKHYLTAEMIADLLARSVKTIRPHLGKMVQERRLFRKYPHDPTRSDQAYTSNPSMKPD